MTIKRKIVIVGGGIVGASAAYHLSRKKVDVTVIDRADAGQATEAAAGMICPWLSQRRNQAWYTLAKNGAAYYETIVQLLIEDGETDIGYQKVGAIRLHENEQKLTKMLDRVTEKRKEAPEIGELIPMSNDEIRCKIPLIASDYQGLFVEGAARVDGRKLRDALLRGATKHGATIIKGSASPKVEENRVVGVYVGHEVYEADDVLITAGAWAKEFVEPLGISLKVTGQKAQIAHVDIEQDTNNWPVIIPPNNQYMLSFPNGKIVIGATYEDQQKDLNITVSGLHEIFDKALTYAPGLQFARFSDAKVGFRPVVPNFMPVIGLLPKIPNVWLVNGLGSSGLTVGPYLGSELAKVVLKEQPSIDLQPYSIEQIIDEE